MTPAVVCSCVTFFGVALTDALRRRHERALREAVRLSGSTMLRAAQEAEIDQAQLTRQFQLVEGSHKRLAMQPRKFWQWYAVTLTAEFGLPIETKRAARLRAATLGTVLHGLDGDAEAESAGVMRQRLLAALVAVQLALGGAAIVRQASIVRPTTVVQPSPCAGLDPDVNQIKWWWYGCTDGSIAGGGGGGAW
jgi:hypothetical protein